MEVRLHRFKRTLKWMLRGGKNRRVGNAMKGSGSDGGVWGDVGVKAPPFQENVKMEVERREKIVRWVTL